MFASRALKRNSVINYDMLYRYVFSSTTQSGYTVYEDWTELAGIMDDVSSDFESRSQGILSDDLSNYGFTLHPILRQYPSNSLWKVEDSIALNPYIELGELTALNGQVTPEYDTLDGDWDVHFTVEYVLGFEDGTAVSAKGITDVMNVSMGDDYSLDDAITAVTYKSDYGTVTPSSMQEYGDIEYIEFIGYGIIDGDERIYGEPIYEKNTLDVIAARGTYPHRYERVTEVNPGARVYISDIVTEEYIVCSNAHGASKTNITIYPNYSPIFTVYCDEPGMGEMVNYTIRYDITGNTHSEENVIIQVKVGNRVIDTVNFKTYGTTQMTYTSSYRIKYSDELDGEEYQIVAYMSNSNAPYTVTVPTGATGYLEDGSSINAVIVLNDKPVEAVYNVTIFPMVERTYNHPDSNYYHWAWGVRDRTTGYPIPGGGENSFIEDYDYEQYGSSLTIQLTQGHELEFFFDNESSEVNYDTVDLYATNSVDKMRGATQIGNFVDLSGMHYTFDISDFSDPNDLAIIVKFNFIENE